MKSAKIISLTATALLLSLCGIFLREIPVGSAAVSAISATQTETHSFSQSKAIQLQEYCRNSTYESSLRGLLKDSGYQDIVYEEKLQQGNQGSGIALGIAQRNEGERKELLVVFRASVGAEWYSNFHIGKGINHAGFSCAAEFSQEVIEEYLKSRKLSPSEISLTLTGHSRGGAVANLVAKDFTDKGTFVHVEAYTFASPNTTMSTESQSPAYSCIYNLQNPEDFVCSLPLKEWGYTKYGQIINLPEKSDNPELYRKMEDCFMSLTGYPHVGYENGREEIDAFCKNAAALAPTLDEFYSKSVSTSIGEITLYEYLEKVASLLSGDNPIAGGIFILSSRQNEYLAPLTNFLIKGMSFDTVEDSFDLTKSAINSGHTFETYLAWLMVLDENYFVSG